MSSDPVTDNLSERTYTVATPLCLLHVPLGLEPPRLLTILLYLQPCLPSRLLNLKGKRLVRRHADLVTAESMFDSTNPLSPKIRVV